MSATAQTSVKIDIVRTIGALRERVRTWHREGERIALVPTMGSLHAGHLALIGLAQSHADRVVVSVFVNPTQFAAHEDFDAYPRNEAEDVRRLADAEAALVFAPERTEMYPAGHATTVSVNGPAEGLESVSRPHFFNGVATIVTKLLIQCAPDAAVFGEKDYQQLLVVRRLVKDLALPVEIIPAPIIREADGLAMSSRNIYLSDKEREVAPALFKVINRLAANVRGGAAIDPETEEAAQALLDTGFKKVDYVAVRDAETLAPIETLARPARVLVAAHLGKTRLIDNVPIELPQPETA